MSAQIHLFFSPLLCFVAASFSSILGDDWSTAELTKDELQETFGVNKHNQIPKHKLVYPSALYDNEGLLKQLQLTLPDNQDGLDERLEFHSVHDKLLDKGLVYIEKEGNRSSLEILRDQERASRFRNCHFHSKSNQTYASISTCDGQLKGVVLKPESAYVIHPLPGRHQQRLKRSTQIGAHIIYKRSGGFRPRSRGKPKDFCALKESYEEEEIFGFADAFVRSWSGGPSKEDDLIVELAIFIDKKLWDKFSRAEGGYASQKLRDYTITVLNNIQLMYHSPTITPKINFKVVHYEILKTQPSEMDGSTHSHGKADDYLHRFCKWQGRRKSKNWDHAFLMSGYNLHRGRGSSTISGIARLHGMCDPWNTCTLTEGADFTSAFIGTHELGHSVGMRHDEPYCNSKHIMSSSLGPGKVTWSSCSMTDFRKFLDRLDRYRKNCLRKGNNAASLKISTSDMPGQTFSADEQCELMHGHGYKQIAPRKDYEEGICHMMWCGQNGYGRIITSHPALEGTYCGNGKWCIRGSCKHYSGYNNGRFSRPNPINGGWSSWESVNCGQCTCSQFDQGIGVVLSKRKCSNPSPENGGAECSGPSVRGIICNNRCVPGTQSIKEYSTRICWAHRNNRRDYQLTGYGRQLIKFPDRSCKVFCDVENGGSDSRSFRHFGDFFADGTYCGGNSYCIDGKCMAPEHVEHQQGNGLWIPFYRGEGRTLGILGLPGLCEYTSKVRKRAEKGIDPEVGSVRVRFVRGNGQRAKSATKDTVPGTHGAHAPKLVAEELGLEPDIAQEEDVLVRKRVRRIARPNPAFSGPPGASGPIAHEPAVEVKKSVKECVVVLHVIPTVLIQSNGAIATLNVYCLTTKCDRYCPWEAWRPCSLTCGYGTKIRYRDCPGGGCESNDGHTNQHKNTCITASCFPTFPGIRNSWGASWSGWAEWSGCSSTCGPGSMARYRRCRSSDGSTRSDTECVGKGYEKGECEAAVGCGKWSHFSPWSDCSQTCGGFGRKTRDRICLSGVDCTGTRQETATCGSRDPCLTQPRYEEWTLWSDWSTCSRTCDGGIKIRTRTCLSGNCAGGKKDRERCNSQSCRIRTNDVNPTIGVWGPWSGYGQCSVSCGFGMKERTRKCYYGNDCRGRRRDREMCPRISCAKWGGWGHWGSCSEPCGYGARKRVRNCYGLGDCPGQKHQSESCITTIC